MAETQDEAAPTIGFVGLGNMGSALAANLVGAGLDVRTHDVAGPDRSPTGATFVADLADLARQARVVVLSLPNGAISTAVTHALADSAGRKVACVVDTSTVGLDASRSIATLLADQGIGYVDAPVSGGVDGARARTLTVMYAGSPEACATARPALEGLSDRRAHIGDEAGLAQAVKLANNFLSATALAATSEAVAFATSAGVDIDTVLTVLNASSGRSAASEDKFVNHVATGTYASGFANDLMAKDLRLYLEALTATGAPSTVGEMTLQIWQRFAEDRPGVDFTRIYEFVQDR